MDIQLMKLNGTGGVPSPKDYRDIALSSVVVPISLPDSYEVDIKDLPIWYQKKLGACTGFAAAKYKQKLDQIDTNTIIDLSPRFPYAVCKCLDGLQGEGTYPRLSMSVLADYGCSTETTMPNNTDLDHEQYVYDRKLSNIPPEAIEEAKKYKISSYASVDLSIDGIKSSVYQAGGCSMLVRIGSEWYTDTTGKTSWEADKILPIRPPKEIISGHEIYIYKYETVENDIKFYFINSWSEKWGTVGTGWFWYSEYRPFIVEAWTAVDIPQDLLDHVTELPNQNDFKYNFVNSIKYGETSDSVKSLQTALKIDGVYTYPYITGYYGTITSKAVLAFQLKYKIPLSWYERYILAGKLVGPKTMSVLNQKFNK